MYIHMHIYSYISISRFKAITDFNFVLNAEFEYFHAESVSYTEINVHFIVEVGTGNLKSDYFLYTVLE